MFYSKTFVTHSIFQTSHPGACTNGPIIAHAGIAVSFGDKMLPVLVHVARLVHAARVLLVAVVLSAVRWFSNLAEAHVAVILGNPPTGALHRTIIM